MVSHYDKWTRIFDVSDTSRHKKGFTIYKVISMLYPEECPDAVTKITVWKRYNEFKKLHRELKSKHQYLHLKERFPSLPSNPFFKRFDKEVIVERKGAILKFLEYVAKYPQLFTSNEFVKFFETSHTPSEMLNGGSINAIRADLHLPLEQPEYLSFASPNSDDERTLSDTDSVSTLSSLNHLGQAIEFLSDPLHKSTTSLTRLNKKINSDSLSETINEEITYGHTDSSTEYLREATHYITEASEQELAREYEKAFTLYKAGIDVLLRNVKSDEDVERRQMVQHKIEKYLLRAEKIYNVYLSPEIKNIQELTKVEREAPLQKPLCDLYKYKVIKVIASGMLVIHSESQQLFYVKVIYKSWKFSLSDLNLPENVPYMVKLYNFYNCENALFLILQYCCGIRLVDYLKQDDTDDKQLMTKTVEDIHCEDETETSYADLLNEYVAAKIQDSEKLKYSAEVSKADDLKEDVVEDMNSLDIVDLLEQSQKLLSSVESTLSGNSDDTTEEASPKEPCELNVCRSLSVDRQLSDRSGYDDFDLQEYSINMSDVVKWAAQLLVALEKLHANGVICCDLDFKNLLVDEHGDLMLTYMCSVSEVKPFLHKTSLVVAPELYGFDIVTPAADWWSYGAILYELLSGLPLKAAHPEGVFSYTSLRIPRFVSPEGRSLLKQLLAYEPHQRLGCGVNGTDDIKSHPFFSSVSWDSVASKCD